MGAYLVRPLALATAATAAVRHVGLPRVRLQPRSDGAMDLAAEVESFAGGPTCGAVLSPRGVAAAVKGPPWIPVVDRFDRHLSLGEKDLELLASAGVTFIRLGAMMPGVLPNPPNKRGEYAPDRGYLDILRSIVESAAAHGIYTMIEFHQDVLSELFCGEGLPRWVALELQEAFPREFEEHLIQLIEHITPGIPGLRSIERGYIRGLLRRHPERTGFPAPLSEPYAVLNASGPVVYAREDCTSKTWWKYQTAFAVGHAWQRLLNMSSSTFRHFLEYWKILARTFKGNPNVLAFELFNEPMPGSPAVEPWIMLPIVGTPRLEAVYARLAAEIHAIDATRLVAFSPVTWEEGGDEMRNINGIFGGAVCAWLRGLLAGLPLPGCEMFWEVTPFLPKKGLARTAFSKAPLPNQSIFSFHFYTPPELNHEVYAAKRREDARALHVYPLLSESCCLGSPSYMEALYFFEKQSIGWSTWEFKRLANGSTPVAYGANHGGSPITGIGGAMFHQDGSPVRHVWRQLAHPSAQFVYGEVVANIFEYTTGLFNLTFLPATNCTKVGPDAIINWPWTWWAFLNATSEPNISGRPLVKVVPEEAADVLEAPREFFGGVARYQVHVRRGVRARAITVTLSFEGYAPVELKPESQETYFLSDPWWAGLGWPLLVLFVLLLLISICALCCGLCRRWCQSRRCQKQQCQKHPCPPGTGNSSPCPGGNDRMRDMVVRSSPRVPASQVLSMEGYSEASPSENSFLLEPL